MAVVENRFVCDLAKPVQAQALKGNVFSLDNLGSRLSVLIYDNGQPATISGSITANCILPDGSTVNVNGGLTTEGDGSKAYVDVPQSCLLIPGILKIAIKCTSSSVITTLAAIVANVYMTKTDNVITPSQQIIDDWNAAISSAIATQNESIANQGTKIDDLKSAFDLIKCNSESLTATDKSAAISSEGVVSSSGPGKTAIVPIDKRGIYKIAIGNRTDTCRAGYSNTAWSSGTLTLSNFFYVKNGDEIPADTNYKYLYVYYKSSSYPDATFAVTYYALADDTLSLPGVPADAKATKNAITYDFEYLIGRYNLLEKASFTRGAYINASGVITQDTNDYGYSDLIPVESDEYTLLWETKSSNNWVRIHAYDSEGTWKEQLSADRSGTVGTHTSNFDTDSYPYIRISANLTTNGVICLGKTKTVDTTLLQCLTYRKDLNKYDDVHNLSLPGIYYIRRTNYTDYTELPANLPFVGTRGEYYRLLVIKSATASDRRGETHFIKGSNYLWVESYNSVNSSWNPWMKIESTDILSNKILSLIDNKTDYLMWEQGSLIGTDGTVPSTTLTTRIRTITYIPDNISAIKVGSEYKVAALAWLKSDGSFVGVLQADGTYDKTQETFYWFTNEIPIAYIEGTKAYKLVLSNAYDGNISPQDAWNCSIIYTYSPYTRDQYVSAFVARMNKKAAEIGMTNSVFYGCDGYSYPTGVTGYNKVTARDMMMLGIACCANPIMCEVWGKSTYTVITKDSIQKSVSLTSTVYNSTGASTLTNAYTVLGGKTGHVSSPSAAVAYTLVAACVVSGKVVVGAIGGATGQPERFYAMKELMDIAAQVIAGNEPSGTVTNASYACCAILPENPQLYKGKPISTLYEQNADTQYNAASNTKCLSMLLMLELCTDINKPVTMIKADIVGGSGAVFSDGDSINYKDILYAAMLPSSNQSVCLAARTLGYNLLNEYHETNLLS